VSLVLRGPTLAAADQRIVEAFAAEAAVALRQQRLAEQAAVVGQLTEVDRLRTALLTAVGHDFRTPLAAATAAVSSLRSPDVEFSAEDRAELLATAEESLDRLSRLVENLLDMSRLQAGALALHRQPIGVAELIPIAVDDLGDAGRDVTVRAGEEVPDVSADAALLERVLANLIGNAVRHSPPGRPPMVTVSEHDGRVEVRVIDHGPGIATQDYDRVFLPFQRLGDRDNTTGLGLGLALARGLTEAMGGTLTPDATPGGGVTMTVSLPAASPAPSAPEGAREAADRADLADPAVLDRVDHWRPGKAKR
jgi:two-component system sensor histidine kinase KdpD